MDSLESEMRKCPFCGEAVRAAAKVCPYCRETIDAVLRAAEEALRAATDARKPFVVGNNNNNNN